MRRAIPVEGSFKAEGIEPVIELAQNYDMLGTLHHEAVHALNAMGLFTGREWTVLQETAKKQGWLEKHNIEGRYRGFYKNGKPTEKAVEEAIADEFRAWMADRSTVANKTVNRLMEKMRTFFQQLLHALRLAGYNNVTAEGVFRDVDCRGCRDPGVIRTNRNCPGW